MTDLITPSNITFVLGMLAIIFSVYNYFRNPQLNSEKADAIFAQKLEEIQKELALLNSTLQAHIQADLTSFSGINNHIVEVDKSVVRLTTIIEERIPKSKKNR